MVRSQEKLKIILQFQSSNNRIKAAISQTGGGLLLLLKIYEGIF